MKKTLLACAAALALAGVCGSPEAPPINIPTDVTPNGDPAPGGSCKGGPEHTIAIDGKTYECWDRHWREKK